MEEQVYMQVMEGSLGSVLMLTVANGFYDSMITNDFMIMTVIYVNR